MLKIESLGGPEGEDWRKKVESAGRVCDVNKDVKAKADWLEAMTSAEPEYVITKMTAGVKDKNRVNVFVNGRYTLSLDVKQVVDLQVKVGRKLTDDELQELHKASEFGKLYQRSLEWAFTRPHSIWETRDYLKRRQLKRSQLNRKRVEEELKPLPEIQDSAIDLVIERLAERGYIDDRKFAEYYAENRFIKKGISKRRLELELRQKRVSDNIINEVLAATTRQDSDELVKMIAKKRRKYDPQKLVNYLVRQGFKYQDVVKAVERTYEEEE